MTISSNTDIQELEEFIKDGFNQLDKKIDDKFNELDKKIDRVGSELKQEISEIRGDVKTIDARMKNIETSVTQISNHP